MFDADDNLTGFGGTIGDAPSDTFTLNIDFKIINQLGIFGRYNYGSLIIRPENPDLANGEVNGQAFPDLDKEEALGIISFVVPFDFLDGEEFLVSGLGDDGTQFDLEATDNFPVNDNLSILPAFYIVNILVWIIL